jgi:hypothetical protein
LIKTLKKAARLREMAALEVLAHQMAYEVIVREEYERAKACYLAKKRQGNAGVPTLEPWDTPGMPET